MGGLYLFRPTGDAAADASHDARARAQFRAHGFRSFSTLALDDYRGFHCQPIHGGPAALWQQGGDLVAYAGTLVYRGRTGHAALAALHADFSFPFDGWTDLSGQFALLVVKDGRSYLLGDYFGAMQLFRLPGDAVLSTSFLAAAGALPALRFDTQGVYEFAFNVFPTGDDTVFEEIKRLGPDRQLELGRTTRASAVTKPLPAHVEETPTLAERTREMAALLAEVTAPYVEAWRDAVQCPLSGGLDSRLALAVLRAQGVKPHVYVYGTRGDEDVEIAQAIADAEGFALEVFDKPRFAAIEPDQFAQTVALNFDETDALVTDGGLFDNGGNRFARHARNADGQLAVSGGCGEVFRNFFYLSNRSMRARDVVRAFFARYTRGDTTARFEPRRFIDALEAKALTALEVDSAHQQLSRTEVEQLYPRMRCRAFFGREISLVSRHGGYFMPFFDQRLVARALTLPLRLKNLGLFEAALIAQIDRRLASYPSAYGHCFTAPPTPAHRRSELSTRLRPIWMRQASYSVRRWLGPMRDEHGGLLSPLYLGRVIDLHFPFMREFFNIAHVRDSGLYRRIATLELLAQRLADRIRT